MRNELSPDSNGVTDALRGSSICIAETDSTVPDPQSAEIGAVTEPPRKERIPAPDAMPATPLVDESS
jgi:hypothetical protein